MATISKNFQKHLVKDHDPHTLISHLLFNIVYASVFHSIVFILFWIFVFIL